MLMNAIYFFSLPYHMYHIVEFEDGTVEVVHSNWIEETVDEEKQTVKVAFPPKNTYHSIRKYLRQQISPFSTWLSYEVVILNSKGKRQCNGLIKYFLNENSKSWSDL